MVVCNCECSQDLCVCIGFAWSCCDHVCPWFICPGSTIWASPDLNLGPNLLESFLQGSELYSEWWLGLFTRRPCPSYSHVAHVGSKHGKNKVGEAELRLGWDIFGCLQGGSEVGRGFQRDKEIFVSTGVGRR